MSCASDGAVNIWTMNKSELTHEPLMKLRVQGGWGGLQGCLSHPEVSGQGMQADAGGKQAV